MVQHCEIAGWDKWVCGPCNQAAVRRGGQGGQNARQSFSLGGAVAEPCRAASARCAVQRARGVQSRVAGIEPGGWAASARAASTWTAHLVPSPKRAKARDELDGHDG